MNFPYKIKQKFDFPKGVLLKILFETPKPIFVIIFNSICGSNKLSKKISNKSERNKFMNSPIQRTSSPEEKQLNIIKEKKVSNKI